MFTKLITHRQSKLRLRVCVFFLLLGTFRQKTLQRIWGKPLRNLLESLAEDREKSVQDVRITSFHAYFAFYPPEWNLFSWILYSHRLPAKRSRHWSSCLFTIKRRIHGVQLKLRGTKNLLTLIIYSAEQESSGPLIFCITFIRINWLF